MQEKRRHKRLPIELTLEISEVFKQDYSKVSDLNAQIEVFDISKSGIGFHTTAAIPVGYYFNATITLGSSEQKIVTVLKILYKEPIGNEQFHYGCEFIGLANVFDYVFDDYAESIEE